MVITKNISNSTPTRASKVSNSEAADSDTVKHLQNQVTNLIKLLQIDNDNPKLTAQLKNKITNAFKLGIDVQFLKVVYSHQSYKLEDEYKQWQANKNLAADKQDKDVLSIFDEMKKQHNNNANLLEDKIWTLDNLKQLCKKLNIKVGRTSKKQEIKDKIIEKCQLKK